VKQRSALDKVTEYQFAASKPRSKPHNRFSPRGLFKFLLKEQVHKIILSEKKQTG
jgi:hypothetical protein